jgi:hypothetical protein
MSPACLGSNREEYMIARIAVGTAALGLLLLLHGAALSTPVAAACGTNWTSKKEPPDVIRVLRTATDEVQKVDFEDYVVDVMASGEWPTSLPVALLEAGAQATKQYGWYYTLEGNHRSGYKNADGKCYDVRDDSTDQVYRPETAEPTDKQRAARDELWGLSLRKDGTFFVRGYRSGSATKCADDADSWRLYALSGQDCAKRLDYDSERILRAYYQPRLDFVWAPGTDPADQEAEQDSSDAEDSSPDPQETSVPDESDEPSTADADEQPTATPESDDDAGSERSLFDRLFSRFDRDE